MILGLIKNLLLRDGIQVRLLLLLLLIIEIHERFIHLFHSFLGRDVLKVRERAHTLHRRCAISLVCLAQKRLLVIVKSRGVVMMRDTLRMIGL